MAQAQRHGEDERQTGELALFLLYIIVIAAGLTCFMVIGLTHH